MFSIYHIAWIIISILLICLIERYLLKKDISIEELLKICCIVCVASEFIKTLSVMEMVPSADGTKIYPYIDRRHIPLHLCSLQIITIFWATFTKNPKTREVLLAFLYPTSIVGAALALAMPTIFAESILPSQAFTHPLAYHFFLYHSMLIILGLYILLSKKVDLKPKHYLTSMTILFGLAFLSIYLNSIFADARYESGVLVSVENTTNFFFTYDFAFDIGINTIGKWYLYFCAIAILAFVVIALFYIPVFKRAKTSK